MRHLFLKRVVWRDKVTVELADKSWQNFAHVFAELWISHAKLQWISLIQDGLKRDKNDNEGGFATRRPTRSFIDAQILIQPHACIKFWINRHAPLRGGKSWAAQLLQRSSWQILSRRWHLYTWWMVHAYTLRFKTHARKNYECQHHHFCDQYFPDNPWFQESGCVEMGAWPSICGNGHPPVLRHRYGKHHLWIMFYTSSPISSTCQFTAG